MLDEIFRQKKPVPEKLLAYGFQSKDGQYEYAACVMENAFLLQIVIDATGTVDTTLTDRESGAEYVLYKTSAPGAYIGAVRMAAAAELQEIADQCFEPSVFRAPQTLRVLDFVSKTYGDAPEFLWEKFADNVVWCRKDTKKWYGVIAALPKSKLGFDTQQRVEILDLHITPERMHEMMQREHFYPGWHMNKKSWYTIILDESVSDAELFECIRISYERAVR